MAFITWSALYAQLKDDLANNNWMTRSYTVDGVAKEMRSFSEFMALFHEVEHRARLEAQSTAAPIGRTYARSRS